MLDHIPAGKPMNLETLSKHFQSLPNKHDHCSLRFVQSHYHGMEVRRHILQPINYELDSGYMISVYKNGGYGYAASCDTKPSSLSQTYELALKRALYTADKSVYNFSDLKPSASKGSYKTPKHKLWDEVSFKDKLDLLTLLNEKLKSGPKIVEWSASLLDINEKHIFLNSLGAACEQDFQFLVPNVEAYANDGSDTVHRSLKGRGFAKQNGLEVLEKLDLPSICEEISAEALELVAAPNCPESTTSILLDSDQMMLQIHESIGHPLELDRILGDERNYAGTSFVTLDMFGSYQYGSPLLNVSFNPEPLDEVASYKYDDEGYLAKKELLIENGILKRPLGSDLSALRAGQFTGLANARSCSWNRPPIDRMANINLEPGTLSLDDLISSIEHGVYMKSNASWSIDDSRNKFQFGCEWGRLIENGKLGKVVKKPNYRGLSQSFWRNLVAIGNPDTMETLGTLYCGKGEPNQAIRVGHASPACIFKDIEVFGGA